MKVGSKLHILLMQVSSHDFEPIYLYYILSELKNTARPAPQKTNHQTFNTYQASLSAVFLD